MKVQAVGIRTQTVNAAILFTLIIAALHFGKFVFLPMVMAILLAFVLAPIVRGLRLIRIPRVPAVLLVVSATFVALFAAGMVLTDQLRGLAEELPKYETTLRAKVRDLRGSAISSPAIERAAETLKELQEELDKPDADAGGVNDPDRFAPGTAAARTDDPPKRRLIPVEVHYPEPRPLDSLLSILATMIEPVAMLTIVIVLVLFILIQKEDLRDRFIRLVGSGDMQRTTAAMTDAAGRMSRFMLNLTLLNTVYGASIAAALWWLGIPAPILWGILATFMRFVPIIGSFIAAAFPVILAAAVDPGWSLVLITLGLYVVGEGLMGQVIEPLIQGRTTGLSPLAILIAAAFWTLLWGPVGLLLAVPITLCLVVLGQYVDSLKFLHVLLGDEPALTPPERFYQRSLAGDAAELSELAEQQARKQPVSAFYQNVAIEGLRLAQAEADRGRLEASNMERIGQTIATMVDNIWELRDAPPAREEDAENGEDAADTELGTSDVAVLLPDRLGTEWQGSHAVVCVPAKSAIDVAGAHLLSHIVERHGLRAEVVERAPLLRGDGFDSAAVRIICVCALSEQLSHARFLARRIRRHYPDVRIVAVLWGADEGERKQFAVAENATVDRVAANIRDAVEDVVAAASRHASLVAETEAGPGTSGETVGLGDDLVPRPA